MYAKARQRIATVLSRRVMYRSAAIDRTVLFDGIPIITGADLRRLSIGKGVVLVSSSRGTLLGVRSPVILRLLTIDAQLAIGADTGLSGTVICAAKSVTLGSRCLIGADSMIFDTDFHSLDYRERGRAQEAWHLSEPVHIGDDVFIGARCLILKGVSIGAGAVIGAGSVVTSDVPPGMLAAGVPARIIRRASSV